MLGQGLRQGLMLFLSLVQEGQSLLKDSKGKIYEWDGQHGEVEIYDKTGKKHLGAFDHKTGKKVKVGKKGRTVKK